MALIQLRIVDTQLIKTTVNKCIFMDLLQNFLLIYIAIIITKIYKNE